MRVAIGVGDHEDAAAKIAWALEDFFDLPAAILEAQRQCGHSCCNHREGKQPCDNALLHTALGPSLVNSAETAPVWAPT